MDFDYTQYWIGLQWDLMGEFNLGSVYHISYLARFSPLSPMTFYVCSPIMLTEILKELATIMRN
jgi:hypothetical protein